MGRRFLVVDDSPVILVTLQKMLEREGVAAADIRTVQDGSAAIETFHAFKPDVVFMDIKMPGMDGEQASTLMLHENPEVRVIIVSGLDRDDKRVSELVSMGAFAVLRKPVRSEDVVSVLRLLEREEPGVGRIR